MLRLRPECRGTVPSLASGHLLSWWRAPPAPPFPMRGHASYASKDEAATTSALGYAVTPHGFRQMGRFLAFLQTPPCQRDLGSRQRRRSCSLSTVGESDGSPRPQPPQFAQKRRRFGKQPSAAHSPPPSPSKPIAEGPRSIRFEHRPRSPVPRGTGQARRLRAVSARRRWLKRLQVALGALTAAQAHS